MKCLNCGKEFQNLKPIKGRKQRKPKFTWHCSARCFMYKYNWLRLAKLTENEPRPQYMYYDRVMKYKSYLMKSLYAC